MSSTLEDVDLGREVLELLQVGALDGSDVFSAHHGIFVADIDLNRFVDLEVPDANRLGFSWYATRQAELTRREYPKTKDG